MPRIKSISLPASAGRPGGCGTVLAVSFLGIFCVIGTAIGYFASFKPLYLAYQARSWTATACEVVSSRLEQGAETSIPDIVYRYRAGGREYTSNRYHFIPGSTGDPEFPAIVERHSPGTTFECYVDPQDPSQAVINRTPTRTYYLGLALFVMFAGIPAVVSVFMLRSLARARRAATTTAAPAQSGDAFRSQFAIDAATARAAGPLVLTASASPLGKLAVVTLVCLFVNGILGVFTYVEYQAWLQGISELGCVAVFLVPFQVFGLVLIGAVAYQLLALANPRPTITLGQGSVPLGGSVPFRWELSGAAHRVSRLKMILRGREEARYRRGTDTSTDTHVFFEETLVDASQAMAIERGSGAVRIPADTMHTFTADNNKVIWTLEISGEIRRWPDLDESFEIMVRPS
jgi:hypothetical protein